MRTLTLEIMLRVVFGARGEAEAVRASLAWAFERLARHPAVQARLREGDPAHLGR